METKANAEVTKPRAPWQHTDAMRGVQKVTMVEMTKAEARVHNETTPASGNAR